MAAGGEVSLWVSPAFVLAFLGRLLGAEAWVGVEECWRDGLGGCEGAVSDGTVAGELSLIMKEIAPVYVR